jgi:glycine cleavage system H protein
MWWKCNIFLHYLSRFICFIFTTHEYARIEGNIAIIGISVHTQNLLGHIVLVDLPGVGDEIKKDEIFTKVESVKALSDVYPPVSGTIIEVNKSLEDSPEFVNESAEGKAWFVKVEMSDKSEADDLLTPEAYYAIIEEE